VAELARALENLAQSEQKLLAKFNVSAGRKYERSTTA